jgi:cell division protein FtsB
MRARKLRRRRSPQWYFYVIIVLIIGCYATYRSGKNLIKIWRLTGMIKTEEKTRNDAIKTKQSLEQEVFKLTNDSTYIEDIARKEYGMIKKGEEVFELSSPDSGGVK